ncbi:MAG TPA: hypothetical protein VLK65_26505 [Vicinamibacteria bacterium]|nr:hypothetical protein [Vicinamibacteria bacterium]
MMKKLTVSTLSIIVLAVAVSVVSTMSPPLHAGGGATQIAGIAFFADPGECVDEQGDGSDFALRMTGDLVGCHYVSVEEWGCTRSGNYHERGTEVFVGEYNGQTGTFATTYLFTAKLASCPDLSTEIFGRCQHPIVRGSGTGDFQGVTGRFDIKDDIEAGNFPYRGHLRR